MILKQTFYPVLDFRFNTIYMHKLTPEVNHNKYIPKRMFREVQPTNYVINGLIKASHDGPLTSMIVERITERTKSNMTHIIDNNRSVST